MRDRGLVFVGDYVCRSGSVARLITNGLSDETSDRYHLLKFMALLKGPRAIGLQGLSQAVPPFSSVLTILLDTDRAGIKEAMRLASAQRRVTAVVLRGFDADDVPLNPTGELRRVAANVVECWPGEAACTVTALGKTPDPGASARVQEAVRR